MFFFFGVTGGLHGARQTMSSQEIFLNKAVLSSMRAKPSGECSFNCCWLLFAMRDLRTCSADFALAHDFDRADGEFPLFRNWTTQQLLNLLVGSRQNQLARVYPILA